MKGKTDPNSLPFEEDKCSLPILYPFKCFKKLFKIPRELRFWPWLNLYIINKIETRGLDLTICHIGI